MKNSIHKEALLKIKSQMTEKTKIGYQFVQSTYQKLNKRHRMALLISAGLIILLLTVMKLSLNLSSPKTNVDHFIQLATQTKVRHPLENQKPWLTDDNATLKLQKQLNRFKLASSQQFNVMQKQLQAIQSKLLSLPSLQDVQQLQQQVSKPNKMLLEKVDGLQNLMQTIVQQTAKKIWVKPKTVEKYFRLVAIQGFSDGMRAIIDVNGNQSTLSIHENCPACRGWVLQHMDFANQSAVFAKSNRDQKLFVKLQAN